MINSFLTNLKWEVTYCRNENPEPGESDRALMITYSKRFREQVEPDDLLTVTIAPGFRGGSDEDGFNLRLDRTRPFNLRGKNTVIIPGIRETLLFAIGSFRKIEPSKAEKLGVKEANLAKIIVNLQPSSSQQKNSGDEVAEDTNPDMQRSSESETSKDVETILKVEFSPVQLDVAYPTKEDLVTAQPCSS